MTHHGHIHNLPHDQYRAAAGISKSALDLIAVSPLAYWDRFLNPDPPPALADDEPDALRVGSATHGLVLEPDLFEQQFCVGFDRDRYPDALDTVADLKAELARQNLMTAGSKLELAARLVEEANFPRSRIMLYLKQDHEREMGGRTAVSAREYRDMLGMLRSIQREPSARNLLRGARVEQSFFWRDPQGVLRKCRTDAISSCGILVVDLKTTMDCGLEAFGLSIDKRRYHVQAAYYLDILQGLFGSGAPEHFAFVAVEKTRPWDVAVHYLDPEDVHLGRLLYQRDLALLAECEATQKWPGKARGQPLGAKLPYRAKRQLEELTPI